MENIIQLRIGRIALAQPHAWHIGPCFTGIIQVGQQWKFFGGLPVQYAYYWLLKRETGSTLSQ